MTDDVDVEESISESVLPVDVEQVAVPIILDTLQPWHQPRKQFVREQQWRLYAERLIRRLEGHLTLESGVVRYLTLPGVDQFDVEILGELCSEKDLNLEAVGFLAEAEKDPIRARTQVRTESLIKRGLIRDTSVIYPYRLEEVTARRGQAYRDVRSRAPFHIINIDACGSIAAPSAQHSTRIIDALHRLIEIQLNAATHPWMLFITTDARPENLSPQVNAALAEAIRENARESDEFRVGAISCFGAVDQTLDEALESAGDSNDSFVAMFSLGLTKWLLHNAAANSWDVKPKAFYSYSTTAHGSDATSMPCLAFEFAPRPIELRDQFGAVIPDGINMQENRPNYSMEALRRATEIGNLDQRLEADLQLRTELAERQLMLLRRSGYKDRALDEFRERFLRDDATMD